MVLSESLKCMLVYLELEESRIWRDLEEGLSWNLVTFEDIE